jgi:hypothetical protein
MQSGSLSMSGEHNNAETILSSGTCWFGIIRFPYNGKATALDQRSAYLPAVSKLDEYLNNSTRSHDLSGAEDSL